MSLTIAPPTSPTALLVLSLLSTGGQHHEKEIEAFAHTNRASHFIFILRKDGWEIRTIKGEKGEGSSYMMTNADQASRVQDSTDFDITSALATMDNPPPEAPDFQDFALTSMNIASQLQLFTPANLQKDTRFDNAELIAGSVDILRKALIEILSGRPSIKDMKAHGKLAKALTEILGAIDILNGDVKE